MKWLAMFPALINRLRKPRSADRIVYSLPEPLRFRKYYNQDEFFQDVDWNNWTAVVDGFEKRFQKWYFDKMTGGHASYMDLCALCALIEVFSHYEHNKDWHEPKNYKEFLRKLDSVFRNKVSTPISITRYENGFWKSGKLRDFADIFYTGVRCSLHHHGDLAAFAGMKGTGHLAHELKNAGKSLCGRYSYPIVIFDPAELRKRLHNWLAKYCERLRKNPDSGDARQFREKFQNDFGISIPAPAKN